MRKLISFLIANKIVLLLLAVPVAFAIGQRTVAPMKLVEQKIIERLERVPYGVPQPFPVFLPGTRTEVQTTVERIKEGPTTERIIVRTPPVFCQTREECDKIYQAAEQRINVSAAIRRGTVMPVLLNDKEVNLPLARDFPFELKLVMSERGIFHGLEFPGGPLKITEVRTETRIEVRPPERRGGLSLDRFKPIVAFPAGAGLAYEVARIDLPIVGRFSADALGTFWPNYTLGAGLSKGISPSIDLGIGFVGGTYTGPVIYGAWRP